ncbi:MAG: M20/M25/M40 family metallo-hydrolase [Candidatus Heimdallarchaeota archaeon]|nr:M20/M25/M40 family metallo-hydrolase [Candidatus Heimdallarchaeota archaeon]MCK4955876.1 M20/M25/M40 family metallo-hydrolase [Candidatus Heimdallarchaeota archaeon]
MKINQILEKIKADFQDIHLKEIQRFIKQPSVSADGNGIIETAEMLVKKIEKLGGKDVHLADLSGEAFGHPIVFGEIFSDVSKPTLLFYSMYDVQPVFPENWIYDGKEIDPFGAEIIDFEWIPGYSGKCLMGRGVCNQKGPTIAFFNVLDVYKEIYGELPFNLIFALEGEEELGSIHVGPFIDKYKEKLKRAKVLLFPAFWENEIGRISMPLGVRGVVALKLKCKGGKWGGPTMRNQHSAVSGIIQSPVFKLIECLNSLKKDSANEILVPGIMNDPDIIGPDEEDEQVIENFLKNYSFEEEVKRDGNIQTFRFNENNRELSDREAIIEMLFKPGISINGIEAGYYGKGSMTIIPKEIKVNIDIRLPPFQSRSYVIDKYKSFLDKNFPMVEYEFEKGGYEAGKIPFSHPLAQTAFALYKEFNKEVLVLPLIAGSAPFALYQKKLDIPFLVGGIGHSGRAHSPLEYAVIESDKPEISGIIDYELYIAKLLNKISAEY